MSEGGKSGFRAALAHRDFRLLLAGLSVSFVGDWMYGVALLVYVLNETGSAALVAVAGAIRVAGYVLFGALGGVVADRYERRAVLLASDLLRAVVMFVLAAVTLFSGPVALVIALAFLAAALATPFDPALTAMTPAMVGERDLAPANSAMSVVENVGLALGPAVGGFLLLLGPPPLAFAVNAVTFLVSATCVFMTKTRSAATAESRDQPLWERLTAGFRAIRASADVALLLTVSIAPTLLYGQENVLLVLVSERLLGTGADGVGFLFAAVGIGGLIGAFASTKLAEHRHPGSVLGLTMGLSGLSLIGLSFTSVPAIAYAFMTLDGLGGVILDVVALTMLQRLVSSDVMARVFGILMTLSLAVNLAGTAIAPITFELFGLRPAVLLAGLLLPVLALVAAPRLRSLDKRAAEARDLLAPRVRILSNLAVFRGTAPGALDLLAKAAEERSAEPGETIVAEGEPAEDFYVVRRGELEVWSAGEVGGRPRLVNTLGEGDYFGEIGLLKKMPRTATVRAVTDSELYAIAGDVFVDAVGQAPSLAAAFRSGLTPRLARTHPSLDTGGPGTTTTRRS